MNKFSIQAAALILAMSASAAMASAQTASAGGTPKPLGSSSMSGSSMSGSMSGTKTMTKKKTKKSSLARHGPPIDAAGANSGSSSNPASGGDIPSTTGATTGKAK
jgi:hypothetical protein